MFTSWFEIHALVLTESGVHAIILVSGLPCSGRLDKAVAVFSRAEQYGEKVY